MPRVPREIFTASTTRMCTQHIRNLSVVCLLAGFREDSTRGFICGISAAKHAGAAVSRGRALLDDLKGILRFLLL